MIKAKGSEGPLLPQVIQLAEIDVHKCDVRVVGDPEDKMVVAFAAWERSTARPASALNWRYPPLRIDEEEERAIWSSYKNSMDIPTLERISGNERATVMTATEVEHLHSNFSGDHSECWFLREFFFIPQHEAAAVALIDWGKTQAARDEACLGTFQPRSKSELFYKCGFYELETFRIECSDYLEVPRGEEGEVCPEGYAAGGVHRTVYSTDIFHLDDGTWGEPDIPGSPRPYRPGTPVLCV